MSSVSHPGGSPRSMPGAETRVPAEALSGHSARKSHVIDSSSADIQVTLSPSHSTPSPSHSSSPFIERRPLSARKSEERDELHSTPGSAHDSLPLSPSHSLHHSPIPKIEVTEITHHDTDAEGEEEAEGAVEEEAEARSAWSITAPFPLAPAPAYTPYIPSRDRAIPYALRSASAHHASPIRDIDAGDEDEDMAAQYPSSPSPRSPVLSVSQALGAVFSPVSLARYALSPSRSPTPPRHHSRLSHTGDAHTRTPSPSITSAHLYAKSAGRVSEWGRVPREVEGMPSSMKRRYVDLERSAIDEEWEGKRVKVEGESGKNYWNRSDRPVLRLSPSSERDLRAEQQARELVRRRMELERPRAGSPNDELRLREESRGRGARRLESSDARAYRPLPEVGRGRSVLPPSPRSLSTYRTHPYASDRLGPRGGRGQSLETDETPLRLPLSSRRADRPYPLTHRATSGGHIPDQLSAREWFLRNRMAEEVGRERTLRQAEMGAGRHPFVPLTRGPRMEDQERLIRATRDAYALDLRRRGPGPVLLSQGPVRPVGPGGGGNASEAGSVGPASPSSSSQNSARKRVDDDQLAVLHAAFNKSAYPPTAEREALGRKLGMTSRSVQIWFQNRRRAVKVEKESAIQKAELEAAAAVRAARGGAAGQGGGAVPMPFGGR